MIRVEAGRWEGLDDLGPEELEALRGRAEAVVRQAATYFQGEIKKTLTGARSGRTYRVSRTGQLHVASAPGEPPAVLFGNLRNSIGASAPVWDGWTVSAEVGPGLGQPPAGPAVDPDKAYARRLEWGGTDARGIRIDPRPYMEPTALRVEPVIERMFEEALG